jgi:hypothetical protein
VSAWNWLESTGSELLAEWMARNFSHIQDAKYMNETLARHGFIGATPDKPVITFSFQLLNTYCQLHRVCPQFSLDALSKSLTNLHQVKS